MESLFVEFLEIGRPVEIIPHAKADLLSELMEHVAIWAESTTVSIK
jgi:hypothetical protein